MWLTDHLLTELRSSEQAKRATKILKLIPSAIDVSRPLKGTTSKRQYRVVQGGFKPFTSSSRGRTSHVALEMERELYFTSDSVNMKGQSAVLSTRYDRRKNEQTTVNSRPL